MGYPVISTWCKAIDKGYFRGWNGLTSDRVRKFIKPSEASEKGHMDQRRANIRSTKSSPVSRTSHENDHMIEHEQTPNNDKTNMVFMTMVEINGQLFTDQTGRFPVTSNRGNNYIVIFYAVDPNYIKSYPIKSRHRSEILKAYDEVYQFLRFRGYRPQLHKLDNETSKDVEAFVTTNNAKFQYTPPDMHRTNTAERAIRTWKNHFIAVRAGTPRTYRLSNWCKDLEQTDITLNMLRPCTTNPRLSAYEAMEGMFAFDKTPMAPIGTEVMIHIKPTRRQTWGYHAIKAWYFAPALNHYRCIKTVTESGAVRISDTFKFLHHTLPEPVLSNTDRIVKATQHLLRTIEGQPTAPPDEMEAIQQLRNLITKAANCQPKQQPKPEIELAPNPPNPIHTTPVTTNTAHPNDRPPRTPNIIPFNEDEYSPPAEPAPRYNLRSRPNIILSAIKTNTLEKPTGVFVSTVIDHETGDSLEYRHLIKHDKYKEIWTRSYANELGRLTNGIRNIPGTNTMEYIHRNEIPKDRLKNIAYSKIVVVERPHKKEKERTRLTVVGTHINYPWDKAVPTSDLTTAKILFNSVISTPGATFHGGDIKNFYLNTPMDRPEYMKLKFDLIPDEIVKHYKLRDYVEDGWVYVRINLGMYGLPQAGILANKLLAKRLASAGYYQCQYTPGLWRHVWRPITFCLVVDDFGIKTVGLKHAKHLQRELEKYYECSMDWKGELFCGVQLTWDYKNRTVRLSMPQYARKALTKFGHKQPSKPQHSPYQVAPIQYGLKHQHTKTDNTPRLSSNQIKFIQQVVGTFLFFGRAVDPTLAAALSSIASQQNNGTEATMKATKQLLDYIATHPNPSITYLASDMILALDTDGSYLSEYGGRSRAAAYMFLTKKNNPDFHNGAVLVLSTIIKHVMASASETEIASLFYGCKEAIPLRMTLEEMGHPQPGPTPVTTDNSTAIGLTRDTMTPKASKSMDMRFQWLKCRRAQSLFKYLWAKGTKNRADYPSKHHPAKHHLLVRPRYVQDIAPF